MIQKETWYKEALEIKQKSPGLQQQLTILLKKVEEDPSYLPELDAFLRRLGIYDKEIIPTVLYQTLPEGLIEGGSDYLYQDGVAHPSVNLREQEGRKTILISPPVLDKNLDVHLSGGTTHIFRVYIGEEFLEHPLIDDVEEGEDPDAFYHRDLPTITREWERLLEKLILGDSPLSPTHEDKYWKKDVKELEVLSFTPLGHDPDDEWHPGDDSFEGPRYGEWFSIKWQVVVRITWESEIPLKDLIR